MMRRILLMAVLLVCTMSAIAAIKPDRWVEIHSTNFRLLTDLDQREAKERLMALELFRSVVLRITNASPRPREDRVTVVLFRTKRDFNRMIVNSRVGGFFRQSLRTNHMVQPAELPRTQDNTVLYHEYVHYLLRDGKSLYPKWYDEGLADMLATIRVEFDKVIVGAESKMRIERLSAGDVYVPLSRVVNRDDMWSRNPYLTSYCYSMAWAAMNYIYTGHMVGKPDYTAQVPRYLRALNTGVQREQAFVDAFGITPREMESEIFDFLSIRRRGVLALPVRAFDYPRETERRPISSRDLHYELAYLMVPGNPKGARRLFESILEDDPGDMRALAGIGVSWQMQQQWEKGLEIAARALSETDYLPHIEYADMQLSYCDSESPPPDCERRHRDALEHYRAALALQPDNLEARYGIAKSLSLLGKGLDEALANLEPPFRKLSYSPSMNYWKGHLHLQREEPDVARSYLERALNWTHAEKLIEKIKADLVAIDPGYFDEEED